MYNMDLNIKKNLLLFHHATKIPFCVFDNTPKDLLRYPIFPSMNDSTNTLYRCHKALKNVHHTCHIPLLYSSGFCFMALMKLDENTNIMLGPVSSTSLTYKQFHEANKDICDIDDLTHLYRVINQSPHMNLSQFTYNLSLFIKLTFQETVDSEEILTNHVILSPNNDYIFTNSKSTPHYLTITEAMNFQKRILFHIQNGNLNEIERLFSNTDFFATLRLSPSSLEDIKKIFFIYATLCCITVLEEGLEVQKAFPIFDAYISKIPTFTTCEDMEKLCIQVSTEYCQQIIHLHRIQSTSPVVTQCLQYIQNNLGSKITLNDLALHCNTSKRTITRHFAQYHSTTVSEYILCTKLKEASFLLTHSNLTLAEISNHLAFSSQSHFSIAFKKMYYYTPQQYRDKYK